MDQDKLKVILQKHDDWLNSREGGEKADLRSADLSSANLSSADLRSADLSSANLRYANLSSANLLDNKLWSLTGNSENIKSIQNDKYHICYTDKVMQIGCEQHGIKDWFKFDDDRILKMDSGALEWWKIWKPTLKNIIKISPAKPTKTDE